ncbi:unnamed protein product [Symbiodinium sp. CCMP2592]|nr:unnamed protein product [Symbiodinium sp. CCMP2592]
MNPASTACPCRCSCLTLLAVALGGCFVLEQPGSSVLEFYPAFRHALTSMVMVSGVNSVCRVGWWMGHYNARSAKRQYAYSNSAAIRKLNLGALKATARKKIKQKVATTIRSLGPDGAQRYTASKHLKPSEIYPLQFAEAVADILDDLKSTCKGCPRLPGQVPSGLELYAAATTPDDVRLMYETAQLGDVYDYLRGCKYLHIPAEWRCLFPVR